MTDINELARPYRMHNQVQTYDWGTRDAEAYIPHLLGTTPEPGVPYAELWLGAHPKAPSTIEMPDGSAMALDAWIAAHPVAALGRAIPDRSGGLPFLLKVLSAGAALSIQAHPTKAQAAVLHAQDPAHYPDDNHKPEIAIALDGLAALMGLKPFADLAATVARYPEIAAFIGETIVTRVIGAVGAPDANEAELARVLFSALIVNASSDPAALGAAVDALATRLSSQRDTPDEAERRFLDLRRQYGNGDVGLLALFLFNITHLGAGEGLYTTAGIPHAYLEGNIIECMANSDNVVRVGLTPKFKDARTLLEIMDTTPQTPQMLDGDPVTDHDGVTHWIYATPAAEFEMRRWQLPRGAGRTIDKGDVPAVLLIVEGEVALTWAGGRTTFHRGESVFLPACLGAYALHAATGADLFQAAVPTRPTPTL